MFVCAFTLSDPIRIISRIAEAIFYKTTPITLDAILVVPMHHHYGGSFSD